MFADPIPSRADDAPEPQRTPLDSPEGRLWLLALAETLGEPRRRRDRAQLQVLRRLNRALARPRAQGERRGNGA